MAKKKAKKKSKSPRSPKRALARRGPRFVKLAVTPSLAKLAAQISAAAPGPAGGPVVVSVDGNMTSGDLYIVKIDGIKVPMTNDKGSTTVSPGGHWLTTDLVGDVGSSVHVTASAADKQVAACTCTVVEGSNPPRHADCDDDFTV